MKPEEEAKLKEILDTFMTDPNIRQMENYIQHGSTTTLDHCMAVARVSFEINHALHLHVDDVALIRTALLHDYYLYDWHKKGHPPLHGYHHADAAADNAVRDFGINKVSEKAIRSHMWPLNITRIPSSRLAWIITTADKLCSTRETLARTALRLR